MKEKVFIPKLNFKPAKVAYFSSDYADGPLSGMLSTTQEIEFPIGSDVYFIDDNKVHCYTISHFLIEVYKDEVIHCYFATKNGVRTDSIKTQFFKSKEELLKSL